MNEACPDAPRGGRLDLVRWLDLPSFRDDRGVLTAIESGRDIPFDIKRVYYLHDLQADRGGHAHRDTQQVITAVTGSFDLCLSTRNEQHRYRLDDPMRGLYFGPMLFIELQNITRGAVALIFASTHYDKTNSIRSWDAYLDALPNGPEGRP